MGPREAVFHFGNETIFCSSGASTHSTQSISRGNLLMEIVMGESYRELVAWRKAMQLVKEIYDVTRAFPREELYGLTSQLRRAAVSVPSNIAEGQARFSQREFFHFLSHARGSLVEVETQILIAEDLAYLSAVRANAVLMASAELDRILNGLIASVRNAAQKPRN